jgi:hypothetical protein
MWTHWCRLQTQWLHAPHGMGGSRPVGLCYDSAIAYLQAHGYRSGTRRRSLCRAIDLLQACEAGALEGISAQLARQRKS